jgi:hypothetical protein
MKTSSSLLLIAAIGLGGCATVVKGTSQNISVDTNPQGATCTVTRNGSQIAVVQQTPGKVEVGRDKGALVVACTKAEMAPASQTVDAKFNGATFGNILLGGVVGAVVDASTGANYSYPEQISVDFAAAAGGPVTASAPTAPTAAAAPAAESKPAAEAKAAAAPAPTANASGVIHTESAVTMKPVND